MWTGQFCFYISWGWVGMGGLKRDCYEKEWRKTSQNGLFSNQQKSHAGFDSVVTLCTVPHGTVLSWEIKAV